MPRAVRSPRPTARRSALACLAPAALAALLAACGGGGDKVAGPRPGASGSYSGTVAGAITRSVTGVAFYGQGVQDGESVFALGMGSIKADSSFKDAVLIAREKAGVPAPGTYTLHDAGSDAAQRPEEFGLVAMLDGANAEGLLCFGTEGTLTVQSASGGRVKGTYAAKASCLDTSSMGEVAVSLAGTFDAVENGRAVSRSRLTADGVRVASRGAARP